MIKTDVTIIGAGPAGSYLAGKLAASGISAALIDKKPVVGKYACSGLISKRLSSFVKPDDALVEHEVNGAVFHSPNFSFELSRKTPQAYVLDRPAFDRQLFSLACGAGAKPVLGAPAENVSITDGGAVCYAGGQKIESEVIVGCDGAGSDLRTTLGMPGNIRFINGIIAYADEKNYSSHVDLFYGKNIAPGFFAWKIPRGKRTEWGLAAKKNHVDYFKKFLAARNVPFGKFYAHPIIIGEQKSCAARALLVGDAAAQVKPFSGGGIIYGLTSAGIAAGAIKKAFDKNNFSKGFFEKEYESKWHEKLLPKIRIGLAIRETLDSLNDSELDTLFQAISGEKNLVEKFGDMDFL